jgi:non-homologous end joining protein Ku
MAPRANWKGFLRLSLVTCPIALFPATSESEKISFNQINKKTGDPILYLKVDAETGDELSNEDINDKDRYHEVSNHEHVIALEARDKGLMGMLLRDPYEVRDSAEYFDDIHDVRVTKDMLDLPKRIVEQKSGHFADARMLCLFFAPGDHNCLAGYRRPPA